MQSSSIEHKTTNQFSKLILAYLEGSPELRTFYKYDFDAEAILEVIADKSIESTDRNTLHQVLKCQNEQYLSEFTKVNTHIDLLKEENTFTITTGHQLCIFGGPLYFITKAISVISLTQKLKKKYPNYHFVPVFWLASEDHGRGEVGQVNLFNKTFEWFEEGNKPTGHYNTATLKELLDNISIVLGDSKEASELLQIFTNAYDGKKNVAEATRYYLTQLFGTYGLVLIDGDDDQLKKQFVPIAEEEFTSRVGEVKVHQTTEELKEVGYHGQVVPREVNLFSLENGQRIGLDVNADFSYFKSHPRSISPNVVYRPIYQELVLPNLAYVGGPGEIAYWMQLKSLFEHFEINFPMLVLRDSMIHINKGVSKKLQKLNLKLEDFFKDHQELLNAFLHKESTVDLTLADEIKQLNTVYDEIKRKAINVDPSLEGFVESERSKLLKALDNTISKLKKSEKRKQDQSIQQLNNVYETLFPNGSLAERHNNFMELYLKYSNKIFDELIEKFNAFDKRVVVMLED